MLVAPPIMVGPHIALLPPLIVVVPPVALVAHDRKTVGLIVPQT
jgi:hypothetical protein